MADVTLSSAVRSSLLSLQDTTSLIKQTQGRLSSGLRVSSAIDDPVAYFQGKSLTDRAGDLAQKKDGIDQGVSSVSTALDAVTAVENVVQQLKGLANSLKSATGSQFSDLITQFNSLRTQIGSLVADASYQGTNLVNNTAQTLTVEFSDKTASLLTVEAARLDETGLAVGAVATYASNSSTFMVNFSASTTAQSLTAGSTVSFTYMGTDTTFTSGSYAHLTYGTADAQLYVGSGDAQLALTQGTVYSATMLSITAAPSTSIGLIIGAADTASFEVNYAAHTTTATLHTGGFNITYQGPDQTIATGNTDFKVQVGTQALVYSTTAAANAVTLTAGTVITVGTAVLSTGGFTGLTTGVGQNNALDLSYGVVSAAGISTTGLATTWVSEGDTVQLNASIAQLDSALSTLRSQASSLGSNVALLQTRLDFTNQYVNTLQEGAGKLTLADINQEGANLLALQTRQQLGITSLSFAGQAEQSILGLF